MKTLIATPDPEPKRKPVSLAYAIASGGALWTQATTTTAGPLPPIDTSTTATTWLRVSLPGAA